MKTLGLESLLLLPVAALPSMALIVVVEEEDEMEVEEAWTSRSSSGH